ncbi:MAG TPA: RNA chaperone Hfq [Terriglobales bacterium]|nr:RNA chaperone Hfq [Terriglobales bacterium]
MDKPAQNIQDSFLNTARKEKIVITIYLLSGVKLTGRIRSFDKYCLMLESSTQEQMVFKHAISTLVMSRAALRDTWREGQERRPLPAPAAAAAAHPVEGPAAAPPARPEERRPLAIEAVPGAAGNA